MTPNMIQSVRQAYQDEYMNCMARLSEAVTAYAEATLPDAVRNPPVEISPYLYRGVTIGPGPQSPRRRCCRGFAGGGIRAAIARR